METPTAPPVKVPVKSRLPKPPGGSAFYQLSLIFGVAILLATLFTAWTPGQFSNEIIPENPGVASTLPPMVIIPPGSPTATPRSRPLLGIVAGHWKYDSGTVCSDGLTEVDVNLKIATLVQKILADQGFDVDLLAEHDPKLLGYQASALLSIHNDSCNYINDQATGFKVASAMFNPHPERAARLTACLRARYGQITGLPLHSTSVTTDMTSYHAFEEIDPNTPAAIIETGFLNLDRQFLTQKTDTVAQGVVAGLLCYVKNESITPPTPPTPPATPQATP
jgi:N-acetylmuramoyl-L-alanine amidase